MIHLAIACVNFDRGDTCNPSVVLTSIETVLPVSSYKSSHIA